MLIRKSVVAVFALCSCFATICAQEVDAQIALRDTLSAAHVAGTIDRNHSSTQTGLTKLSGDALNRGYALFSAPDLLKTIQLLSGVTPGTELLSSLYVHGGDGSDNLYLLDGVPLYQVCHLGGVFSSFNADAIEKVDFYKSGFPARFGGRLSSVVDIITKDGDFLNYGGLLSLGLLEGRINVHGPVVKGKTSFNFSARRSWADVWMYPLFTITDKSLCLYSFTDLNAKLTHKFSSASVLSASFYYGNDNFKYSKSVNSDEFGSATDYQLSWGNTLASIAWKKVCGDSMTVNTALWWSGCHSRTFISQLEEMEEYSTAYDMNQKSGLNDIGINGEFDFNILSKQRVKAGVGATFHSYAAEQNLSEAYACMAGEFVAHVEDEIHLLDFLNVNLGLRDVIYMAGSKCNNHLEPRISVKLQLLQRAALKASYSRISQFSHQAVSLYLDLPTNYWVPSTRTIPPMQSRQLALGLYSSPATHVHLNIEGWLKNMDNLLEYGGMNTIFPALSTWEEDFNLGKGKSAGFELDCGYEAEQLSMNIFYTLSKTMRFFEAVWPDWYPDRNDKRHKITFVTNWRPNSKYEFYAAWNYISGSRMSIPTHYLQGLYDRFGHLGSMYVCESPNNIKIPDYHRLDLGVNIHVRTRRGRESVWNISVYNAYCRLNPLFASIKQLGLSDLIHDINDDNYHGPDKFSFVASGFGAIPLIPSFSYLCKF